MKNKANMKDEYHIPEYDTIYNGVYGERDHYIPGIIFIKFRFLIFLSGILHTSDCMPLCCPITL